MPKHKSFTLKELAKVTDSEVVGDENLYVDNLSTIENSTKSSITFLANSKYASSLKSSVACAVIVKKDFKVDKNFNYLKTDDPYLAYAKLSSLFDCDNKINIPYIDKSAVISDKSSIDKNVYIGPNVFIGPNCEIGPNVIIHANCSIVKNVKIDTDTMIQHGAVLGSDGFGFAPTDDGYIKIKQLGGLTIGKNVEIGANCTIDRGAIDDTQIHDGVILDNLVHIAHNVILGKNSAIAASCAIAGSAIIGKNFQMGGLSGVLGHLEICENVIVGAQTLVTKSITKPGNYVGIMPIQEHDNWANSSVYIKKLSK